MNQIGDVSVTPGSIDVLVHLGAGRCRELDSYLAWQPKRILLVEADPQLVQELEERSAQFSQVRVVCAAVAGEPGARTFYRYNLRAASGLRPAAPALMQLFPGLRLLDENQVSAVDPAALIEPLKLSREKKNLLVVDVPGEELPVIEALQEADQLRCFSELRLNCGRRALYDGAAEAAAVLGWLDEHGFERIDEEIGDDPERPCWLLRPNALRLDYDRLQERFDELVQSCRDGDARAVALESEITELSRSRDEQARLAQERQARITWLESELAEATHRQSLLDAEILKVESQVEFIRDLLLRELDQ